MKDKLRWDGIGGRNKPKGDKPLPVHLMRPQEDDKTIRNTNPTTDDRTPRNP